MEDLQGGDSEESEVDEGPGFLEELKGDRPKIWGYDYYNVIYTASATLGLIMFYLYIVIDDEELKKMVLI